MKPTRRTVPVEETTSNALVSQCDGFGYDLCDQAERKVQPILLSWLILQQVQVLLQTLRISDVFYKSGLEYVEARPLVFNKNEFVYEEDIKLLKREIYLRDLDITELKRKLELATKEKDEVQLTVQKFENSSKNLRKLLDRQIMDKCKTGLRYIAVPPKPDLVFSILDDFVNVNESVSESIVKKPTIETNEPKTVRKENGAPIIDDWVDSDEENMPKVKTVEMFNKPSFAKINFVKSTEQVKSSRKTLVDKNRQNTPSPRGNKRNWNQQMSQKLGIDFEMFNKACHVCGSFDHLKNDCNNWYNNGGFAKPVWTNVQRANKQNFSKLTHLSPKRNMVPRTVLTRPKAVLGAVKGNKRNTVKALETDHILQIMKKLIEDLLPFEELKFNLFSVSQMCDKKNTVLFTDIECVVLSPHFKLTDESHVLLKVPRKDNMYNVDLKNVVPQGGLTCIFAKATPDESNLWHRRLGHVNFKTMNKLVRGNLVRGLPSKLFEITQTCVACQKRKQHRASCKASIETIPSKDYILLLLWPADPLFSQNSKSSLDAGFKPSGEDEKKVTEEPRKEGGDSSNDQEKDDNINSTNNINTTSDGNNTKNVNAVSSTINTAGIEVNVVDPKISIELPNDPNMPKLEDIVYSDDDEDVGAEADMNNLDALMPVSPIPTTRIHKDHPDKLLQFKLQKVWTLVDLPNGKRAISTKWVYKNKKDERGIVIKNKARLAAQGYTQEEGIKYDEVFAPVARIEEIRLFLAYASFKDFVVYQMNLKSDFLYGKIEEDSNKKKLIQMIKIHTDKNVVDLLTKAFDRIIYKGWLEWNAKAAKDGIGVKTGNSRVNAAGHYLVLLGIT
ncbi:ribonuclease H-like domain-containing protein [Tanacetum coccineum]